MTYFKSVFHFSLMHFCLLATTVYLRRAYLCDSYFTPGKEPLNAINKQIKFKFKSSRLPKAYNPDDVIRFNSLLYLEILLLLKT